MESDNSKLQKDGNVSIGNNNTGVSVIISADEEIMKLMKKNAQLTSDLAWAVQQLKLKEMIIDELLKRLKR